MLLRKFLVSLLVFSSFALSADDSLKARNEIRDFLEAKVMNRVHGGKGIHIIAEGRMEAVWESKRVYKNLQVTAEGLKFDYEINFLQTNYELDEKGKRTGKEQNKDRTSSESFEVHKTETNELFGLRRSVKSSASDPTGYFGAVRLKIVGDKLELTSFNPLYDDFYDVGNKTFPGRSNSVGVFSFVDGKLVFDRVTTAYRVDPVTLENVKELPKTTYHEVEK